MDPVTAIGLAASVLQLVEYGTKLFTTGYQAYKSTKGQTNENEHIEQLTTDLKSVAESLKRKTRSVPGSLSDDELALLGLARRSQSLAQELLSILEKVRRIGKSRTWGAVQVAICATWSKEEIHSNLKKIQEIQASINTRLLSLLRNDVSTIGAAVKDLSNTGNARHAENMNQLETTRLDILLAIHEDGKVLTDALSQISLNEVSANFAAEKRHEDLMTKLSRLMEDYAAKADSSDREAKILSSLLFSNIEERHTQISPPEPRTFEWIFGEETMAADDGVSLRSGSPSIDDSSDDESSSDGESNNYEADESDPETSEDEYIAAERDRRNEASEMFQTWLREEHGVFYISGKAGSGKSTFMKFIADHRKTRDTLAQWAKTQKRELTTAGFFFWNAGSALQKSHEGLLRSLLFQILNQCRSLIPRVFPERWKADNFTLSNPMAQTWTLRDLSDAISRLTDDADTGGCCFCFFIDGLDEYHGEHRALVKDIQRLCKSPFVKVCASSRPWNIFWEAFGKDSQTRKLSLQHCNSSDIYEFIQSQLVEDDKFKELVQSQPEVHKLVRLIKAKADGVFLWVVLVVRELHAELDELGSYEELMDKLDTLPQDLDRFFQRMMEGIKKPYRSCMARLLLLCMDSIGPFRLIYVHFLYESRGGADVIPRDVVSVTSDVRHLWEEEAKSKVNKWCRDLLDVHEQDSITEGYCIAVQLLHRSVKDYLQQEHVLQQLYDLAGRAFDPRLGRARLGLAHIRSLDDESAMFCLGRFPRFTWLTECALSELGRDQSVVRIVEWRSTFEEIDAACMDICIRNGKGPYHWSSIYLSTNFMHGQAEPPPVSCASLLMFATYRVFLWYVRDRVAAMSDEDFRSQGPYLLLASLANVHSGPRPWRASIIPSEVQFLLLRGANINAEIVIERPAMQEGDHPELVKRTVWESFLNQPSRLGSPMDYVPSLRLLLEAGADLHCALPEQYISLGDCLVSKHIGGLSWTRKETVKLETLLNEFDIPVTWTTVTDSDGKSFKSWEEVRRKGYFLAQYCFYCSDPYGDVYT